MKQGHDDDFKIYVDRLQGGKQTNFEGEVPPDFIGVNEETLRFTHPVHYEGAAYLANDELVIRLKAKTIAELPCSICNAWAAIEVELKDYYDICPLEEIRGKVYDIRDILREELLLQVPFTVECEGKCPRRKDFAEYLKKPTEEDEEEGQHPFKDL